MLKHTSTQRQQIAPVYTTPHKTRIGITEITSIESFSFSHSCREDTKKIQNCNTQPTTLPDANKMCVYYGRPREETNMKETHHTRVGQQITATSI
jgi:hypothetical protein